MRYFRVSCVLGCVLSCVLGGALGCATTGDATAQAPAAGSATAVGDPGPRCAPASSGDPAFVPLQLEVPTLAWDAESVVLVWHKPDSSADVVDYRVYMDCQLLGSAAVNNTQVSPAKSHIDGLYA